MFNVTATMHPIPLAGVLSLPRRDHAHARSPAEQQKGVERYEGNSRGQVSHSGRG